MAVNFEDAFAATRAIAVPENMRDIRKQQAFIEYQFDFLHRICREIFENGSQGIAWEYVNGAMARRELEMEE
ncbi:hypothetical protein CkaCkLH20_02538 [Colletotrichum karsti]|uniref:Uncharacterized protein n=1 Tax=Colletotrichum karsti TaxID=1095194 RepID=A0A9P6IC98_9PEZI|nr:uncharacterized protein CkaCkLH20_02538 [Colletotrichum karsti]KAF9879727.1 hypothetical protein CkaCkLH20_02538 [Colletotrichum karsti]